MKLIACCLFAVGTLSAQEPAGPVVHEVPLLTCSGLPCVELTSPSVNVLRLVIDLASVNAYLDTKAARSRSLKLEPLKGSSGSDIADVQQTVIPGARIGDLPLGDFPFMVLDTTEDAKQPGKKKEDAYFPADGALAFGSFKNRRIQIDWNRHVLRISEPITDPLPCPRDCGDLIIRHFGQYGPVTLTATGFEIERQTVTAQLDTFFTGTMLIYPDSVEKLGLKEVAHAKHKEEFPFSQGGLRLTQGTGVGYTFDRDPVLTDAPVYFWGTKDYAPPRVSFEATVGLALLNRALFTLDFKSNHIWMEQFPAH